MEPRALRRDALRNRARLVAAAREGLAEEGSGASLERVAARAGVGIGTLYRHFPTREALIAAVFDAQLDEWLTAARAAAASDDPWQGLCDYLGRTLELQAAHRALHEVFLQNLPGDQFAGAREEIRCQLERLLERARAQGTLRADFTVSDLALLLWSLGPVSEATAATAPQAARRHLGFVLDGLRASAATPRAEPALTDDQLAKAHRALRDSRRRPPPPARAAG